MQMSRSLIIQLSADLVQLTVPMPVKLSGRLICILTHEYTESIFKEQFIAALKLKPAPGLQRNSVPGAETKVSTKPVR